jgi:hypothetical protein
MSMWHRPVKGTATGEDSQRWFVDWDEQWSGIFGRSNWYDFTLIDIEGEYAPYSGRYEFSVALLGVRVTITYVYDTSFNESLRKTVDEIKASRP